jgi:hypothetical protein
MASDGQAHHLFCKSIRAFIAASVVDSLNFCKTPSKWRLFLRSRLTYHLPFVVLIAVQINKDTA